MFVLTVSYTGASTSSDKSNEFKLNIKPWTLGVWGFLFALDIYKKKVIFYYESSTTEII
jgi:hypothetical protein